jgi:UDP-glucose 4-epimerase
MTKQVLVTGGTGYIGSHTTVELIQAGYEVIIVDNLINSRIEVLDGIEQITGTRPIFENFDLCDRQKVTGLFQKYPKLKAIIHFAALKAVGESVEMPLEYYHNNIESLVNLLSAMSDFKVPSFVFSSSCTVYGQPDKLPVTEDAPIKKASSPYAKTKQMSEEIISDTMHVYPELNAISLRYFNPIGAHKSALIGELPLGVPLNLVPFLTQTAVGVREQLRVFGSDYETPDGTGIRDYINVVDLAQAHVAAIARLIENRNAKNYEVFNLGTGRGYSVLEIINAFEKATGVKVNYKIVDRRPGDIAMVYADSSYANDVLGWKAKIPIEETLITAWNWEKNIRKKLV